MTIVINDDQAWELSNVLRENHDGSPVDLDQDNSRLIVSFTHVRVTIDTDGTSEET
jgi:hypothetical protein